MTSNNRIFIALGSNLGDRSHHLNTAIQLLEQRLGLVMDIAPVYKVPADGFHGDYFFNTVALLHTIKTAQEALEILKSIELEMGRLPRSGDSYENRVIDLDIILYNDEVTQNIYLQIPHERMQDRNFVLQPLSDIAPNELHPILKVSIHELAKKHPLLTDTFKVDFKYFKNTHDLSALSFIAIEGNIGSGKTSLTHKIAQDFNAKTVLERFAENPFLPLFYKEPERYSFPLEMSFLADRYQQLTDDVIQGDLFTSFTIADYYVVKSLIFSEITLNNEEFILYKRLFNMMYKELVKPDLYIYLYQTEDRLLENIKNRGRDYEQQIEAKYLHDIQQGYAAFIRSQQELNVKVIDVTDLDFVNHPADYLEILKQLHAAIA